MLGRPCGRDDLLPTDLRRGHDCRKETGVAAMSDPFKALHTGLVGLMLAAVMAVPALAETWEDRIAEALVGLGYEVTMVHRTLLGRVRIVAVNDTARREIVINPHSGEVLRDFSSLLPTVAQSQTATRRDRSSSSPAASAASDPIPSSAPSSAPSSGPSGGIEAVTAPVAPRTGQGD